jgi:hypothetical protein
MPHAAKSPVSDTNFSEEPKIVTPTLQAASSVPWTAEMPQNINIGALLTQFSVTRAATGTSSKSIPLVSDCFQLSTWLINGAPHRTSLANELFGRQGLNALDDAANAGTVQYFQGGNAVTAVVNGITWGALPVLLGSEADVAIQAALANNTDTTAVFGLPFVFAEDFRKSYKAALAMALPTAFGDGKGNVTGNLGGVVLRLDMNPMPGGAGNVTSVAFSANVEYDNVLAQQGTTVRLLKKKRLSKQYAAAGDIEVADQIKNVAGESTQYISLLTAADPITKVVIKQGNTLIRTMTASFVAGATRSSACSAGSKATAACVHDSTSSMSGSQAFSSWRSFLRLYVLVLTRPSGIRCTRCLPVLGSNTVNCA